MKLCRKNEATEPRAINPVVLAALVLLIAWLLISPSVLHSERGSKDPKVCPTPLAVEVIDPNKPASELNHHLAGCALIAIALLVFLGESSGKLRFCRRVWPLLFIGTGLFLAVWSDAEIWPRGPLSWLWLVNHDFEARQHKIFALLLLMIGIVEHARARGYLSRFWRIWAFPVLALSGACLLLLHDHTQGSGATSPEAQAYSVSWSRSSLVAMEATVRSPEVIEPSHHHMIELATSGIQPTPTNNDWRRGMQMKDQTGDHHHQMTASAVKVEKQHLCFLVVGAGIAVMKLLSDGDFWRRWFVPSLWPSLIGVLGLLLVLYKE